MKKYEQTVAAKNVFYSELLDLWLEYNGGTRVTRQVLCELWGKNDRTVRKEINRIANYFAIFSSSDRKGYELAITPSIIKNNPLLLKVQLDNINHSIAEFEARKTEINARMKPLIAYKEVIIQYLTQYGMEHVKE